MKKYIIAIVLTLSAQTFAAEIKGAYAGQIWQLFTSAGFLSQPTRNGSEFTATVGVRAQCIFREIGINNQVLLCGAAQALHGITALEMRNLLLTSKFMKFDGFKQTGVSRDSRYTVLAGTRCTLSKTSLSCER